MTRFLVLLLVGLGSVLGARAQVDEAPVGLWLMYFGTASFTGSPLGAHAEVQLRNHAVDGDLQQLLLRTSVRYTPDPSATLSLGYGYILSESEGEPDDPFGEHRIYQEAFLRQAVSRLRIGHRFRYEQRFVEGDEFQTRYRYALSATLPLTSPDLRRGTVYAAVYAEPFLRGAGRGERPVFDRTRLYGAVGYVLTPSVSVQAGYMDQVFAADDDGQLQLSVHQSLPF